MMRTFKSHLWLVVLLTVFRATAAPAQLPEPRMVYLENEQVRIGMDLALGGAVTFLSSKERPGNLINSADLGRQIQMSHYSGPWPFETADKKPNKSWAGLGWNPIQTGDCYLNPSKVVEHRNDGRELYIKCIPMQWPHNDLPGDCLFETWTTLEGPIVHMRFRCTNQRSDQTFYRPCAQELPAVYTISKLDRLMAYTGDKPFTGDVLTHVTNDWHKPWPWTRFIATERWAALVGSDDWGIGVFKEDGGEFHGGIHGEGRSADPKHGSTAYVAPIHMENFDHNIVYEHRTDLMVGKLDAIRERFTSKAVKTPPQSVFKGDRQHWTLRDATDQGFPLKGAWRITFGDKTPHLESTIRCWRAEDGPSMELEAAHKGKTTQLRVFWKLLGDEQWDKRKSLTLDLNSNGEFSLYRLKLSDSPEYKGLITAIAIEPEAGFASGDQLLIKGIGIGTKR
jgi:hypothetical protein